MKHLAILVLLLASCSAQTVTGGSFQVSGGGGIAFSGNGGSIACGPPLFLCSYTGQATVQWPAIPNFGSNTNNFAVLTDASYPSGTPSRISRCTDKNSTASTTPNQSKSVGLGGSGDAKQLWNQNSTALHFHNTGGSGFLILFNPTTMLCAPVAITANKNLSNPGSATVAYNFGDGSWDWTDPTIWYGFGGNPDTSGTQAAKYTINLSTGQFTVQAPIVDFSLGLPVTLNTAPAWQPGRPYVKGDYVSHALTGTEAPDWIALHAYSNVGDIIWPRTGNPLNCGFKLVTAGTSAAGGSQPIWSTLVGSGVCVPASNGTITDGTAKWRNLGGPAVFTFQLTSAGGTSGGSTPAFCPASPCHPDLMTTVSDNGLTWTNTGPMVPPPWTNFAGVSRDGTRFCAAFSSNSYGLAPSYTQNADQGTGLWAACYSSTLNSYVFFNTGTGIWSKTTCAGGAGYNCSGGTIALSTVGASDVFTMGTCSTMIHNMKGSSTADYSVVQFQGALSGGCNSRPIAIRPFLPFDASASAQAIFTTINHWAVGSTHVANLGDTALAFGFLFAQYDLIIDLTNPVLGTTPISWQVSPCTVAWVGDGTDPSPPCSFGKGYDSHLAWLTLDDADTGPMCGTVYNDSANIGLQGLPLIVAPWQGEEVCISTSPTWAGSSISAPTPNPGQRQYRFTHIFNTMTNAAFDTQFGISQLSQDGKFLAFSSDWACTLGDTSGNPTSLCGLPWQSNHLYALNTLISPIGALNGTGAKYDVFKVTTPGISGVGFGPAFGNPNTAWASCTGAPGCTVADSNGVVYTDQGPSNGKGEVFIVETR